MMLTDIDSNIVAMGDINMPRSSMIRLTRQKLSKEAMGLTTKKENYRTTPIVNTNANILNKILVNHHVIQKSTINGSRV